MTRLLILLMPWIVSAQWGLTEVGHTDHIPSRITGELYCTAIYDQNRFIKQDSLERIGNFHRDIIEFYNEYIPFDSIITGYRVKENRRYICIETRKGTFLIQDTVIQGFRFMQVISKNGLSTKFLLRGKN